MSLESLLDVLTYVQDKNDLTSNEVLVLLAVGNYVDKQGENGRASIPTLMKITKLSKRTMQYYLDKLVRRALLKEERSAPRGGYIYHLLIPPVGPLHKTKSTDAAPAPVKSMTGANCNGSQVQIATSRSYKPDPFKEEDPVSREERRQEGLLGIHAILATLGLNGTNGSH